MQDEGGAKGLNPVLEKHWEKFVLGVVVAAGLIYVGAQFSGGGNTAAKGIDLVKSKLKDRIDERNSRIEPPKAGVAPAIPLVVAADTPPIWSIGNRTQHIVDIKGPVDPKVASFFLPNLTLTSPKPGFEGIEFTWSLSPDGPDEKIKPPPIVLKPATFFFQIERRKKGDADWQVLEPKLKGDNLRYIDTKTTPKTEYEYKVTLGSNDPQWSRQNPKLLSDKIGGPAAVWSPGIWMFEFSNARTFPEADPPKPGEVYVKIIKHDPEAGRVEWTRIHKEGKPLGFSEEGGVPTPVHGVFSARKRRMVPVNFNCGGKVERIEVDKLVRYQYQVCKPVAGPGGLVCPGPVKVPDTYKVNEVTYTDEEGKRQVDRKSSGPGPRPDQLCEDHGGAPPPKELSREEKDAAREKEAETLLEEADGLWAKETPSDRKKAQEKYRKLLDSYADMPGVKTRAAELRERSKKKLE